MDGNKLAIESMLAWNVIADYAPRVVGAIVVLLVGFFVTNWLTKVMARALARSRIDATFRPMIAASLRYLAFGLVALVVLQQFGVQTASLLAVLGAAGLAIGLALQNTLSNVAAGLVLLFLRPFEIGDHVAVSDQSGVVLGLALFHTQLRSDDGVDIVVPNNDVLKNAIRNMSHYPDRVLTTTIEVASSADPATALAALRETLAAQSLILKTMPTSVAVETIGSGGCRIAMRGWVVNADHREARSQLLCAARERLRAAGIDLA